MPQRQNIPNFYLISRFQYRDRQDIGMGEVPYVGAAPFAMVRNSFNSRFSLTLSVSVDVFGKKTH